MGTDLIDSSFRTKDLTTSSYAAANGIDALAWSDYENVKDPIYGVDYRTAARTNGAIFPNTGTETNAQESADEDEWWQVELDRMLHMPTVKFC